MTTDAYYSNAAKYWSNISPTVEGMLGGFGKVSPTDIDGSARFLKAVIKESGCATNRACDCGAGIGRITKHLLKRHFDVVDLVEQNAAFLDKAKDYLGPEHRGDLINKGLQDFEPAKATYDVVWCQWVLGHLTDDDLAAFLRRCANSLTAESGVLVVKENVTSSGEVEADDEDSSVTRPEALLRTIFDRADLEIVREAKQQKFPKELYPVMMYALRPKNK